MSGVPSWAHVGAKCVCISKTWFTPPMPGSRHPEIGETLTIGSIKQHPLAPKVVGFAFAELDPEDYYGARNFRPVVNDDTEAAIYRAKGLKTSAPKRVSEDA